MVSGELISSQTLRGRAFFVGDPMCTVKTMGRWIILLGLLLSISTPSQAITVELAKKCRSMAIKAHPTRLYGMKGSATSQREYYTACLAREGNMQDQATGSTLSGK